MTEQAVSLLLVLCLMQIKHMFADFYLQTEKMLCGRGEYFHFGRAQHAAVHAIGSAIVFFIYSAPLDFILLICLFEWFVHFNIDYCKARYSNEKQLTPQMAVFWRAVGTDQALHQLTYIAMVAAWIKWIAA